MMIKTMTEQERITKRGLIWRGVEERLKRERRQVRDDVERLLAEREREWQGRESPSQEEAREVAYSHRESLHLRLRELDEALERLRHKTYGSCVDCNKKIAVARLFNDLAVSRCLDCQTVADGEAPA